MAQEILTNKQKKFLSFFTNAMMPKMVKTFDMDRFKSFYIKEAQKLKRNLFY